MRKLRLLAAAIALTMTAACGDFGPTAPEPNDAENGFLGSGGGGNGFLGSGGGGNGFLGSGGGGNGFLGSGGGG